MSDGGGRSWRDEVEPDLRPRVRHQIAAKCAEICMTPNTPAEELRKLAAKVEENTFSKATSKTDYLRRISLKLHNVAQKRPQLTQQAAAAGHPQQMQAAASTFQVIQGANPAAPTAAPQSAASMTAGPLRPPSQLPNHHVASRFAPSVHMTASQGPFDMMAMLDHSFSSKPAMVAPPAPSAHPGQHAMQPIAFQNQNQRPGVQLQQHTNAARCHPPNMARPQGQLPMARPNGHQNHLLRQNVSAYAQQLQLQQQQQVDMQRYQMLGANAARKNNNCYPGGWNYQQNARWAAGIQSSPFKACEDMAAHHKQTRMESHPMMPPPQKQAPVNLQSNVQCPSPQTPATMESAGGADWREEMLQQINSLKDAYFSELMEFNQNLVVPRLTEEQFKSFPREKADRFNRLVSIKTVISSVLKFLQLQKSEMPDTLRGQLPKYQKTIHDLLGMHGRKKACNADTSTGPHSRSCPGLPLPQIVNVASDGKSDQQKHPAVASIEPTRQNAVSTVPPSSQKSQNHQLLGVASPRLSINPPGGLQSSPTNDIELWCTASPIAKSGVVQVTSPDVLKSTSQSPIPKPATVHVTSPDTLLKSTSQSPIAKPGAVAAASPCASVKSTLTSTVERTGFPAAGSPCSSVKSTSPSGRDSLFLLQNNAAPNGYNQTTPTELLTPAPQHQAGTSASQAEDQVHGGAETLVTKKPIDRLIAAVLSSSPAVLRSSANSMESALDDMDSIPLMAGNNMKRVYDVTTPYYSESDSVTFECDAPDSASSGHHRDKRQKTQNGKDALLDEIEAINNTLIDTEISMASGERADAIASCNGGTLIKFSYTAVSLAPDLKSHLAISQNFQPVVPVMLLVPADYPASSPAIVDGEGDAKLRTKFSYISEEVDAAFRGTLRSLPEPRALKDTAKAWDACVRRAITEYAYRHGGGTLNTSLGRFESCVGA